MSASAETFALDESRFLEFDPFQEEVRRNWEAYAEQWAGHPPFYALIHGAPAAVLSSHADVTALYVGQAKSFQSAPVTTVLPDAFLVFKGLPNISMMDGDEHQRVRRAMQPAFGKDGVGLHQARIDAVVDELLDEISARGDAFNAAAEFSRPLMHRVLLREMLSLADDKVEVFVRMNRLLPSVFVEGYQTPAFKEAREGAEEALEAVIADRRARPSDDFIGLMTRAETEGVISHDELVGNLFAVCAAALESTADSMSQMLIAMTRFPDQFALVRDDPGLVPSAVEESLRLWNAEYISFPRYALVDTEIGGLPIPRGLVVFPFVSASNRDPAKYPDPTRYDVHRNPTHHHAFALGAHHCIGSILARRVLQSGLRGFLRRYPAVRLANADFKPVFMGIAGALTIESVPMLLGPAA
jgi:cytochrome P450